MSFPLISYFDAHCRKVPNEYSDVVIGSSMTFDAVASIVTCVLGILGTMSVVSMPMSAAYGLIATSVTITVLWIAFMISVCKNDQPENK